MTSSYEELITLPGIGEYTAGAIASIVYQEPIPAVDGNVLRVISRILGSKKDVLLAETKKEMTKKIQSSMPKEAGDFNEGLMELGETICIPNGIPNCEKCPLKGYCVANKEGLTEEIPVREKKIERKKTVVTVFLLTYEEEIAVRKRKQTGLLSGLYEFPNKEQELSEEQIQETLKEWNLEKKGKIKKVGTHRHVFSHLEWEMTGYEIEVVEKNEEFFWITKKQLQEEYALPTAFASFRKKYLSKEKE